MCAAVVGGAGRVRGGLREVCARVVEFLNSKRDRVPVGKRALFFAGSLSLSDRARPKIPVMRKSENQTEKTCTEYSTPPVASTYII